MSGDNIVRLEEVMTDDRFNLASIYDYQHNQDDSEVDYNIFPNNGKGACDYYEPHELVNHTKCIAACDHKRMHSYMHLNCRGLSSNWEKFTDYLCDIHSDEFSFDYIGIIELFRCDRDQRISLPGYHDIITRCRESTDDYRGGVTLFIKETIDYIIRKYCFHSQCL